MTDQPQPQPAPCKKCGEAWFLSYSPDGKPKFCGVCSKYDAHRVQSRWTLISSPGCYDVFRIDDSRLRIVEASHDAPDYDNDAPLPRLDILAAMDVRDSGMTIAERQSILAAHRAAYVEQ